MECPTCGNRFTPYHKGERTQKFCSKTCAYDAKRGRPRPERKPAEHYKKPIQQDDSWMLAAACRGKDTEDWFSTLFKAQAKWVCGRCRVIDDCLKYALRMEAGAEVRYGIYGGLDPAERAKLARRGQKYEDVFANRTEQLTNTGSAREC